MANNYCKTGLYSVPDRSLNVPVINGFCPLVVLVLLFSVMLKVQQTQAQPVYIDLVPDVMLMNPGNFYLLDLNNDGTNDFRFELFYLQSEDMHTIWIRGLTDSSFVAYYSIEGCHYATAFAQGDSISALTTWAHGANIAFVGGFTTCMHSGSFNLTTGKALGLKLAAGGITYYAWMRIEVGNKADWITLKDYLFDKQPLIFSPFSNLTPGHPDIRHSMIVQPNPVDDFFTLRIPGVESGASVQLEIADRTGRVVKMQRFEKGTEYLISMQGFNPGMYFGKCWIDKMEIFYFKILKK